MKKDPNNWVVEERVTPTSKESVTVWERTSLKRVMASLVLLLVGVKDFKLVTAKGRTWRIRRKEKHNA